MTKYEISYTREYEYFTKLEAKNEIDARNKADAYINKILENQSFENIAQKGYIETNIWEEDEEEDEEDNQDSECPDCSHINRIGDDCSKCGHKW
jgi:hypothetical protein